MMTMAGLLDPTIPYRSFFHGIRILYTKAVYTSKLGRPAAAHPRPESRSCEVVEGCWMLSVQHSTPAGRREISEMQFREKKRCVSVSVRPALMLLSSESKGRKDECGWWDSEVWVGK